MTELETKIIAAQTALAASEQTIAALGKQMEDLAAESLSYQQKAKAADDERWSLKRKREEQTRQAQSLRELLESCGVVKARDNSLAEQRASEARAKELESKAAEVLARLEAREKELAAKVETKPE